MSESVVVPRRPELMPRSSARQWAWVRLGEHVTKIGSGITPLGGQAAYLPSGIPLIRSQNVLMNSFRAEGIAFISREQDAEMEGSRVQAGDVLLNITGASIGRVCVVPADIVPANVNQHVSIIRTKGTLNPKFLAYYLSRPEFQTFIQNTQAGATRQALTKSLIEDFMVPLPPPDEQEAIVRNLDEQLCATVKARNATDAQLVAVSQLARSVLRECFSLHKFGTWRMKPLAEVGALLPAKSIATTGNTTVQVVTTACLTELGFNPSGIKAAQMWDGDIELCTLRPNEILIARSNTPDLVGRVAMYTGSPSPIVASDLTIRLLAHDDYVPEYVTFYLSNLYACGYWKERAGGASGTMKKITRKQLESLEIPVPTPEQQLDICKSITSKTANIRLLGATLGSQLIAVAKLQPALLSAAFGGMI